MPTWISLRPLRRAPIRAMLIAVLACALTISVMDTTAPALKAAAPKVSVTNLCDQSVSAVETAYRQQAPSVASGPVVNAASYTLTNAQATALADQKQQALAACRGKLQQAKWRKWSYLSARAVEIAVDAAITFLAATLVCSLTGPAGCAWGVRFASFAGGFVGALAFQYLTDGFINWTSVGSAFFDATVSMLAFSGLDKLEEAYVGRGVRATFQTAGQALKSVGARIGGVGSGMVGSIQNALEYVFTHTVAWAFPGSILTSAYRGGGSVVQALSEQKGQPIAGGIQLRVPSHASGWSDVHDDLYSGSYNTPYYNWDVSEGPWSNSDGAIGYVISQGNNCLTATSYNVALKPCSYRLQDTNQHWFADGDELMSSSGKCLDEDATHQQRWLVSCDGLNYAANPGNKDDQFLPTPRGGTYIPDTIANWKNHVSVYEHA